ncbi:MAG: pantetheine-phosphate adenylyltransferase [Bacilli bacterium]|nr:pantetheine-phosphate adenylyltransferase [Bacilli bacterium]
MALKKEVIFAGTFDPFTLGHLAVVKQALKTFNKVIILLAINDKKKPTYSIKDRMKFIKLSVKGMKGVEVDYTDGYVVDYAKKHHINILIRGIRNEKDYEYESKMSKINQKLAPDIMTLALNVSERYQHISSSKVRELKQKGEDLSPYVNKAIIKYL